MATVPGPRPDQPVPRPGAPGQPIPDESDERERQASPDRDHPEWMPEPYHPEREVVEPGAPAPVP